MTKPAINHARAIDLKEIFLQNQKLPLKERAAFFDNFLGYTIEKGLNTYSRLVVSPPGRTVKVLDNQGQKPKEMLMFASNNYLGLANHPHVKKRIAEALKTYGSGLGGPPLLNGYTRLTKQIEERLAHCKKKEAAMIFSSGYSANLGLVSTLARPGDHFIYDRLSHASFYDGLKHTKAEFTSFKHNSLDDLEKVLSSSCKTVDSDTFICIEGVYSMDGDLSPLDRICALGKKAKSIIILDDAHGTGVLGKTGAGTAEHFGVSNEVDLVMGTFSKSLAVTGGFVAGDKAIINYLRYHARSYIFSAALPPFVLSAVGAGLDIIESEPWRRKSVLAKTRYATKKLAHFGLFAEPGAAILALKVPEWMNIRIANRRFNDLGIFLNAIEYPAVPQNEQRFRISFMAEHTLEDIDRLVSVVKQVWHEQKPAMP